MRVCVMCAYWRVEGGGGSRSRTRHSVKTTLQKNKTLKTKNVVFVFSFALSGTVYTPTKPRRSWTRHLFFRRGYQCSAGVYTATALQTKKQKNRRDTIFLFGFGVPLVECVPQQRAEHFFWANNTDWHFCRLHRSLRPREREIDDVTYHVDKQSGRHPRLQSRLTDTDTTPLWLPVYTRY